ncbi:nuclear transport factor 2 family protein [Asanoa sp. WMMD1127]|uniref:nuclear transport factor 2 family protein n=1 Tax=Asanoa sp. WMMD1127 TaxID=3016107 RepID=UPI0024178A01|nr:nuclear transport factor 2 family protein [Asanoa sp. WMMD1127]MDG4825892.1 nuclear transport factor 2 family protein [Asanoa sp. WMMD1127]
MNEHDDRQALRDLVDAYARLADRRDGAGQSALFTPAGRVVVEAGATRQVLEGRAALAAAFEEGLRPYARTTHFNGQSTVALDGDRATGETYCLAHHLWTEGAERTLMVMSIRYLDSFVRSEGRWLIAERRLIVDWVDRRPSAA